jgi:hypothetical protein
MKSWLRGVIRHGLRLVDLRYQRAHDLHAVGQVLFVGRCAYAGPPVEFEDGTRLAAGDPVGMLHFNNARFISLEATSATRAALGFARLMLESMHELARLARDDPAYADLQVFHAISWLPAHGHNVGFITRPVPVSLRKRLMSAWFRLLVWAFAPAQQSREARPDPHFYWLTRKTLVQRFTVAPAHARIRHAQSRTA